VRRGERQHLTRDERIVNAYISLAQSLQRGQREETWIARARPHEPYRSRLETRQPGDPKGLGGHDRFAIVIAAL
jgi:hypothetical protein